MAYNLDQTLKSYQIDFPYDSKQVKGMGIDLTNIFRIAKIVKTYNSEVLSYLFTAEELTACMEHTYSILGFATCFAGKEAIGKALGTGLTNIKWTDIEVIIEKKMMHATLFNDAYDRMQYLKITNWFLWKKMIDLDHIIVGAVGYV